MNKILYNTAVKNKTNPKIILKCYENTVCTSKRQTKCPNLVLELLRVNSLGLIKITQ